MKVVRLLLLIYTGIHLKTPTRKPFETRPAPPSKKRFTGAHRGYCIICANEADKEALFRESGVILVEKYCDKCLKKLFDL